jgi:hypothetical protein
LARCVKSDVLAESFRRGETLKREQNVPQSGAEMAREEIMPKCRVGGGGCRRLIRLKHRDRGRDRHQGRLGGVVSVIRSGWDGVISGTKAAAEQQPVSGANPPETEQRQMTTRRGEERRGARRMKRTDWPSADDKDGADTGYSLLAAGCWLLVTKRVDGPMQLDQLSSTPSYRGTTAATTKRRVPYPPVLVYKPSLEGENMSLLAGRHIDHVPRSRCIPSPSPSPSLWCDLVQLVSPRSHREDS